MAGEDDGTVMETDAQGQDQQQEQQQQALKELDALQEVRSLLRLCGCRSSVPPNPHQPSPPTHATTTIRKAGAGGRGRDVPSDRVAEQLGGAGRGGGPDGVRGVFGDHEGKEGVMPASKIEPHAHAAPTHSTTKTKSNPHPDPTQGVHEALAARAHWIRLYVPYQRSAQSLREEVAVLELRLGLLKQEARRLGYRGEGGE